MTSCGELGAPLSILNSMNFTCALCAGSRAEEAPRPRWRKAADQEQAGDGVEEPLVTFTNAGIKGKTIGGQAVDGGDEVAGDPCR